jgi:hypothetical protein
MPSSLKIIVCGLRRSGKTCFFENNLGIDRSQIENYYTQDSIKDAVIFGEETYIECTPITLEMFDEIKDQIGTLYEYCDDSKTFELVYSRPFVMD